MSPSDFKRDSEVGIALHEGYSVYFVVFFPEPCPGQTIADVLHALRRFVEEVARRHSGAAPILYGNCQAGWAITLLAALPGNVTALQFWTVIHAVIAMLLIAVMLAHIYIGTLGMEGAFDAMGTGEVDLNWAREHHSLWVEEEQAKGHAPSAGTPRAMPAE